MFIHSIIYQCYQIFINIHIYVYRMLFPPTTTLVVSPFSDSFPPNTWLSASRDSNNSRHTGSRCLFFSPVYVVVQGPKNIVKLNSYPKQSLHRKFICISSHVIMSISPLFENMPSWHVVDITKWCNGIVYL